MLETVEVKRYTCDGCGKVVMVEVDDDFIGITGSAFEVTRSAGGGSEWFACKRTCVGKAVATSLDRMWSN